MERRFNVKVVFDIEEVTENGDKPFMDSRVVYSDMSQESLLELEGALIGFMGALNSDLGVKSLEKGDKGKKKDK